MYILPILKEALIKSDYFRPVKIARIFHEDRGNRITITTHFVKYTNTIPMPKSNQLNQRFLKLYPCKQRVLL